MITIQIEMATALKVTEGPAIGIDLGTTFSCVAVVRNDKVEVIANGDGNFITPSFVAFNEHERLIGDAAKQQVAANSMNTVFDVKRLIGRKFDDPIVQADMKRWPFKVVNVNNVPKIEIKYKGEVKLFSAVEVSAMVLGHMKEVAEAHLNMTVKNAVITVPAYFNDMQRKATKDAGIIAGLNVTRVINEPTAAAIAYGLSTRSKIAIKVLVYDLGGGTFDVSILNICGNKYEVIATGGDTHLGGEDFDSILMTAFAAEFKRKTTVDITGNQKALRKLRTACERAKRTLSMATHAPIDIDSLADGIDFVTHLTRARLNELCADLFRMTIKVVESTLKDADLQCKDIDTVVLVGGSTRIPKIQQLLQDLFAGKELNRTINPDEAVAYGAAVQAAIIHGNASKQMKKLKLSEVTPLTLGVACGYEPKIMRATIKRNTPLPVSRSRTHGTLCDDQTNMAIIVLQGEKYYARENFQIGEFVIEGIPKAAAGVEKVEITFTIDVDGILNVTAVSQSDRKIKAEITIENVSGNAMRTEMAKMIADAELFREQDRMVKLYRRVRSELEEYCYNVKTTRGSSNSVANQKCNEILSWLKSSHHLEIEQFVQMKNELTMLIPLQDIKREYQDDGSENDDDEDVKVISPNETDIVHLIDD